MERIFSPDSIDIKFVKFGHGNDLNKFKHLIDLIQNFKMKNMPRGSFWLAGTASHRIVLAHRQI